jgi:hypothetical protein
LGLLVGAARKKPRVSARDAGFDLRPSGVVLGPIALPSRATAVIGVVEPGRMSCARPERHLRSRSEQLFSLLRLGCPAAHRARAGHLDPFDGPARVPVTPP